LLKLSENASPARRDAHLSLSTEDEERKQHYFDSITQKTNFYDDLAAQLALMDLDEKKRKACEIILSGLDDEAYLTAHPADLAMASGLSMEQVHEAIEIVKSLEPAGVGAVNLQERLLLQLQRQGREDTLTYRAVKECMDDLANNRLPKIAKTLGVSIEEIRGLVEEIKLLKPRIVEGEGVHPFEYVEEEASIFADDNRELKVTVSGRHLPLLHISKHYRDLLNDQSVSSETKKYIRDKIRAGATLINSISQRQSTLERILNAIVAVQKNYFLEGEDYLKPLTMAEVAEKVGVHETTVSRAASNKYVRCVYGLIPISKFFSAGYRSADGQEVSNAVVKKAIKRYIRNESPERPYSDSALVKLLKDDGLAVARRTVAKYRENMGILPSNLRRQH
jgi:RNA polymerase sigma-54 factor